MRRLEYACTACGQPFGRFESAKRHLANPNIHDGKGIITSLTEYVLGIKQGRYPPPSYNNGPPRIFEWKKSLLQQPTPPSSSQRGHQTTKGTKTMFDKLHEHADALRDLKDFFEITSWINTKAAEISRLNPLPEFLIGYFCDRCHTREFWLTPSLDPPVKLLHQCDPNRVREFESIKNREERLENMRKGFVSSLKSRIDAWTKNSGKYLIAIPISPEHPLLKSKPPYLKKLKVELPVDSKHYLNRAITSMKKEYGTWIALNDYETRNFLEMTYASAAIFEVRMVMMYRDGGRNNDVEEDPTYEHFLVKIVPPHYVEEKKLNDEFARIRGKLLKDMMESLKEEEGEGERTKEEQQEVEEIKKKLNWQDDVDLETPLSCREIRIIADDYREGITTAAAARATPATRDQSGATEPRPKTMKKKERQEKQEEEKRGLAAYQPKDNNTGCS